MTESPSKFDNRLRFFNNAPRCDPANTSFDNSIDMSPQPNRHLSLLDTSFEEALPLPHSPFSTNIMTEICPTQLPPPAISDKKLPEPKKTGKTRENKEN